MYVIEAIRAGAAGYLVKDCSQELLCHTIKAASDGGTLIRSELLSQAIQGLYRPSRGSQGGPGVPSLVEQLTSREMDVLRLLAEGWANREIARELSLAEVTVKKHVQAIIGKLGASDRTHAAITAVRLGLIQ
jgi:DNA-binding NarL/FixJ family response regulator